MPSGKEIRNKIKSVESTRKITKAMEMVAASKMRKAQERMRAARPYGDKIRLVAGNLSHALTDYRHPFLTVREPAKAVGLITVTSDKGLVRGLEYQRLAPVAWQDEGMACRGQEAAGHGDR
jgi:F-type H+-transporting ATPase subunit gamma